MDLIRSFEKLGKNDAHLAGGKGASLGEMTQAGIPVPPGYVILSDSFEQFIRETQLVAEIDSIIDKVNHHEMESVERASETIQSLIMRAKMPKDIEKEIESHFKKLNAKFVAVRSSATAEDSSEAAWAGQLDSFLNTTEKTLLENVKKCWASLFTPRAIFYRFEKKLHQTKISVAVVVQKMVESEISGIGFSVHPVTQDYNQMILEGGFGLGEAIVSGQITPDSYVIEKKPFRILEKNVSEQSRGIFRKPQGGNEWKDIPAEEGAKQKLSDAQVLELGKMVMRIEEHYGFPVDTEWAFEKGKFYIVQSRPITTLTNKPPVDSADDKKKVKKKVEIDESQDKWVKLWSRGMKIQKGMVYAVSLGDPFEKLFGARIDNVLYVSRKENIDFYFKEKEYANFRYTLKKMMMENQSFRMDIATHFEKLYQSHLKTLNHLATADLSALSNGAFIELLREYKESLYPYIAAMWFIILVEKEIEEIVYETLKNAKVSTIDEVAKSIFSITKVNYLLEEELSLLSISGLPTEKQKNALKQHAKKFEYIPMYDYDYSPYSFDYFEERLMELNRNPTSKTKILTKKKELEKNAAQFEQLLTQLSLTPLQKQRIEAMHSLFNHKDQRSHYRSIDSYYSRKLFMELSRRVGVSVEDLLLYTDEEFVEKIMNPTLNVDLAPREKGYVIHFAHGKMDLFTGKERDEYIKENVPTENEETLKGLGVTHGKTKGIAKIVLRTADLSKVMKGDILVAPMTRPDYVSFMKKCSAIITDEGGMLCHAAIISRELNIPCVVGLKIATTKVKDGDVLEVDADTGIVHILGQSSLVFARAYSRDFCLAAIEIAARCESAHKPWYAEKSPLKPYIICERTEGTVRYYYHPQAYAWLLTQLQKRAQADPHFFKKMEQTVRKEIAFIRPIYEKEKVLDWKGLQKFIDSFIHAYTWIEAMWVSYRSTPEEIGADNTTIQALRKETETLSAQTSIVIRESLRKIFPQLGKYSSMLTLEEIKNQRIPAIDELKKRDKGYFFVDEKLMVRITREELEKKYSIQLERIEAPPNIAEITGQGVSKGKVKGTVCRIVGLDDISKIKPGQILVAHMTMVDFMPAMKKAAAFVTDEGGIMCHAAIVAREMKKPCIVGTRIGMAALKDGMEVEVDADRGIVHILDSIKEKPEHFFFRSRYIPSTVPILYFWSWPVEEELGIPQGRIVNIWDNGNYTGVWEKKRFDEIGEKVVADLLNSIPNHQKIRDTGINAGKKVVEHCQAFSSQVGNAKPSAFVSFLRELEKRYHAFARKNMVYWIFSSPVLEARVKETLKGFAPDEYSAIFTTMSKSPISSYSQIEEMEFEKIVQLARKRGLENSEVKKQIQPFSKKYFWFPYEYVGPTIWTPEEVTKRIRDELKKKASVHSNENIQKEQEACIKKYKLSQSTINLFRVVQLIALMQDDRKLYNVQVCYHLNEIILPEIGKRIGATPPEMRYADNTIIQEWGDGKTIRKRLKVRKDFFVAVEDGREIDLYEGEKGRAYLKKEEITLTVKTEGITQVSGQSSYPGIVRGKARILLTSSHGAAFKPGEILITGMTTPDFVSLMKKASAIVTDEGGITSHAAIVARELKKPCIIGAKIATKVFKDGDLIEVDANSGVVKKLQ